MKFLIKIKIKINRKYPGIFMKFVNFKAYKPTIKNKLCIATCETKMTIDSKFGPKHKNITIFIMEISNLIIYVDVIRGKHSFHIGWRVKLTE